MKNRKKKKGRPRKGVSSRNPAAQAVTKPLSGIPASIKARTAAFIPAQRRPQRKTRKGNE
jgi:hypothetical protein